MMTTIEVVCLAAAAMNLASTIIWLRELRVHLRKSDGAPRRETPILPFRRAKPEQDDDDDPLLQQRSDEAEAEIERRAKRSRGERGRQ